MEPTGSGLAVNTIRKSDMDVAALCHLYPVVLQLQQLLPTLLA